MENYFSEIPASRKLLLHTLSPSHRATLTHLFYILSCPTPGSYRISLAVFCIQICCVRWQQHANSSLLQMALSTSRGELATGINLPVPLKSKSWRPSNIMLWMCEKKALLCLMSRTQISGPARVIQGVRVSIHKEEALGTTFPVAG